MPEAGPSSGGRRGGEGEGSGLERAGLGDLISVFRLICGFLVASGDKVDTGRRESETRVWGGVPGD